MPVSGKLFIGARQVTTGHSFHAVNPASEDALEPEFSAAGLPDVEQACELAGSAFHDYRRLDHEVRAAFLETIADEIMALGDELLAVGEVAPAVMLTAGIHGAYEQGVKRLLDHPQVEMLARGPEAQGEHCGRGALFAVKGEDLLQHPEVMEEVFGAIFAIFDNRALHRCGATARRLENLEGQLTTSLHSVDEGHELAARLIPVLELKAGRLIANGWPTAVKVSHAMVRGGPYPAASDSRSTSVGTLSKARFLRPVCYQDFPDDLLPSELCPNAPARPHRLDRAYRSGEE